MLKADEAGPGGQNVNMVMSKATETVVEQYNLRVSIAKMSACHNTDVAGKGMVCSKQTKQGKCSKLKVCVAFDADNLAFPPEIWKAKALTQVKRNCFCAKQLKLNTQNPCDCKCNGWSPGAKGV